MTSTTQTARPSDVDELAAGETATNVVSLGSTRRPRGHTEEMRGAGLRTIENASPAGD